jgi:hypothetical protein
MISNQQLMLMRHIRKILAILHCGKRQSQAIHHGQLHGGQAALVGTLNVLQWPMPISVKLLISMAVDSI